MGSTPLLGRMEVTVVAEDIPPDDPSSRRGASDLSRLPVGLADALRDLRAAMDRVRCLTEAAKDLDGGQAEAVAVELADLASQAHVVHARMVAVIEADGLWSVQARSLSRDAARALARACAPLRTRSGWVVRCGMTCR